MILIGVTAEQGLRFNRAFLLLADEDAGLLRGGSPSALRTRRTPHGRADSGG